jgi:chromosome segregation ATPase
MIDLTNLDPTLKAALFGAAAIIIFAVARTIRFTLKLASENAKAKSELKTQRDTFDQNQKEWQGKLEYERERSSIANEAALRDRLDYQERQIDARQAAVDRLTERVEQLQRQQAEDAKLSANKIAALENELLNIKHQKAIEEQAAQAALKIAETEKLALQSELKAAHTERALGQEREKALAEQVETLKRQIETLQNRVDQLEKSSGTVNVTIGETK